MHEMTKVESLARDIRDLLLNEISVDDSIGLLKVASCIEDAEQRKFVAGVASKLLSEKPKLDEAYSKVNALITEAMASR